MIFLSITLEMALHEVPQKYHRFQRCVLLHTLDSQSGHVACMVGHAQIKLVQLIKLLATTNTTNTTTTNQQQLQLHTTTSITSTTTLWCKDKILMNWSQENCDENKLINDNLLCPLLNFTDQADNVARISTQTLICMCIVISVNLLINIINKSALHSGHLLKRT